ncbi:MAG: metal-dependent transcriptional regulator [Thermoplasmataceae archaeon]
MNNREDYLLVLWEYVESQGHASEKDLVERLGTTPATVSEAISKLVEEGLVTKEGRSLRLTQKGVSSAIPLVRAHRISEVFSFKLLEIPWEDVHASVMEMEHVFRGEMVESLYKNLGFPSSCPHGNPVDPAQRIQENEAGSVGNGRYRVGRVTMEKRDFLRSIADLQALPGSEVEIYVDETPILMTGSGELKLSLLESKSFRLSQRL